METLSIKRVRLESKETKPNVFLNLEVGSHAFWRLRIWRFKSDGFWSSRAAKSGPQPNNLGASIAVAKCSHSVAVQAQVTILTYEPL